MKVIISRMINQFEKLEPLILENLMAFIYQMFGGEKLWMVRIVNAVFWGIGGWFLFQFTAKNLGFSAGFISLMYFKSNLNRSSSSSISPDKNIPTSVGFIFNC